MKRLEGSSLGRASPAHLRLPGQGGCPQGQRLLLARWNGLHALVAERGCGASPELA